MSEEDDLDEQYRTEAETMCPYWRARAEKAEARVRGLEAELELWIQAVGVASTALPHMEIDIDDPVGMMQKVVAEVEQLRGALDTAKGEKHG